MRETALRHLPVITGVLKLGTDLRLRRPRPEESLKRVREGYQGGAKNLSFADVELAVEALNDSRLKLAETRRELWRAIADLQGLMQLDMHEEH